MTVSEIRTGTAMNMSNQIPSQIRDPIVSASVSQEKEHFFACNICGAEWRNGKCIKLGLVEGPVPSEASPPPAQETGEAQMTNEAMIEHLHRFAAAYSTFAAGEHLALAEILTLAARRIEGLSKPAAVSDPPITAQQALAEVFQILDGVEFDFHVQQQLHALKQKVETP